MISTICWFIAIAALLNAARLKYNEVKQARKMRELVERATVFAPEKKKAYRTIVYTDRASLSKWDARFLTLAEQVAAWSKGPRKRIGAVIMRPDKSIASLGYNGPPRGFDDEAFLRMSREDQHFVVIHAEDNALRQTHEAESVAGYTLFVSPLLPCANCADKIAKAGIRRVVAYCGHISPDWRASAEEAERIFINAGVECLFMFEGEK